MVPEVKMANPKGTLTISAASKGGSGAMISFSSWQISNIDINQVPLSKKLIADLRKVYQPLFPDEIQLANPKLTQMKKDALERLREIGKLQHIQPLGAILTKATDAAEIKAIEETIHSIEARLT